MPNFARLELKPSPREFDLDKFKEYVDELKKFPLRVKLFAVILRARDFEEIKEINKEFPEQAALEINQCLIEALDVALNTPEDSLEDEFLIFNQEFRISDSRKSPLNVDNKFYF